MIIEAELREQMRRALRGELSLNDFYDWLLARSWNMHRDSVQSAVDLASEVEAILFERAAGDRNDEDTRLLFLDLLAVPVSEVQSIALSAPIQVNAVVPDALNSYPFSEPTMSTVTRPVRHLVPVPMTAA